jgi:16S rRNA processing protein RimM
MELLTMAKISGTHHLKGAVKAVTNVGVTEEMIGQKVVVELPKGEQKLLTIKDISHLVGNKCVFEFEEITNKTDAANLKNGLVKARRDVLGLEEGEYLANDLLGMKVYDGENREYLGEVTDIFETAAHDILVVENSEFETMIPDVDLFVKEINFDKREILTEIIEGMKVAKK